MIVWSTLNKYFVILPYWIIAMGVIFVLLLQSSIAPGVFYNGDCGLKALQTMQIASGNFRTSLELPAEKWERNMWAEEMYPFDAPFAYQVNNRYFIQYPIFFSLISSPFYVAFGYRGLYLIPILSTLLLWLCLLYISYRMRWTVLETTLSLSIIIFASPVTLYSAIFCEHTLAMLLALGGILVLLFPPQKLFQKTNISIAGILLGLSAWFRPELFCLGLAIIMCLFICAFLHRSEIKPLKLILPFSLSFFVLILFNLIAYKTPFGVRSNEIMADFTLSGRFQVYQIVLTNLYHALITFFPVCFIPLILMVLGFLFRRLVFTREILVFSIIIVLYIFMVPAIVPNFGGKQWPPRYFLILAPLVAILVVEILRILTVSLKKIYVVLLVAAILAVIIMSIRTNTFEGYNYLWNDYTKRAAPPINLLLRSPLRHVAVSDQYLNQELACAFNSKVFFWPRNQWHLWLLCETFLNHHCDQFLYICYAFHKPPEIINLKANRNTVEAKFSLAGSFGNPKITGGYNCIFFYIVTIRRQQS